MPEMRASVRGRRQSVTTESSSVSERRAAEGNVGRRQSLWVAWALLAVGMLTACGGTQDTGVAKGTDFCSTGTNVVLVKPPPGATKVKIDHGTIFIASSATVVAKNAGLALFTVSGSTDGVQQVAKLLGPVSKPKPIVNPLPMPSPVFYKATGFDLNSSETYAVKITVLGSTCVDNQINGAYFRTRASKGPRSR